jgi:hypothetical protein
MPVTVQRLLSPDEWKKKQIDSVKAVGEANYKQRVQKPRADPIVEGIKAEDKYANAVKKAIEEKRRAKALQGVTSDEWLNYTLNVGVPNYVEGVVKREAKIDKFVKNWQPLLLDHLSKVDAMPEATDKDREDKMLANLRGLKALKGKAKGIA